MRERPLRRSLDHAVGGIFRHRIAQDGERQDRDRGPVDQGRARTLAPRRGAEIAIAVPRRVLIQPSPPALSAKRRRIPAICTVRLLSSTASPGQAASVRSCFETGMPARATSSATSATPRRPSAVGSPLQKTRGRPRGRGGTGRMPSVCTMIRQDTFPGLFRNNFGAASGLRPDPGARCQRGPMSTPKERSTSWKEHPSSGCRKRAGA